MRPLNKHSDILLVEDNPAEVRLTKEVFKSAAIKNTINVASDGEEALNYLRKKGKYAETKTPDLVLLDINLPKKNGREVLEEMKADAKLKLIPVIILTTSSLDEDVNGAYSNHANCYIVKPIDLEQFVQVVRAIEFFWLIVAKLPKKLDGKF